MRTAWALLWPAAGRVLDSTESQVCHRLATSGFVAFGNLAIMDHKKVALYQIRRVSWLLACALAACRVALKNLNYDSFRFGKQ
jgi:hypothetical protein